MAQNLQQSPAAPGKKRHFPLKSQWAEAEEAEARRLGYEASMRPNGGDWRKARANATAAKSYYAEAEKFRRMKVRFAEQEAASGRGTIHSATIAENGGGA